MQNIRIAIPYIIWLGVASLFMTLPGSRPGLAQEAAADEAGSVFDEIIGLRRSVTDEDVADRELRGLIGAGGIAPRGDAQLDGDLGAQYEAAMRRIEPPKDGDLGAVPRVRPALSPNEPVLRGAAQPGLDVGRAAIAGIRTARNTTPSPYQPLGIRAGSFRVYPEVSILGLSMDNVRQTSAAKNGDFALELRPSIRIRSNWSRHSLEAGASVVRNYHRQFDAEDARELSTDLAGRIDVTRRTSFAGEAAYSLAQQSRGSAVSPQNALERPDVHNLRGAVALNHRFNRLSLRLRGEIEAVAYDDAVLGAGLIAVQSDRDNIERRLALRGSYELDPGLTIFAEGLVERRGFRGALFSDGISRDADGLAIRAGIIFDNGSKLFGELALGYVGMRPDDRRLSDIDGVSFDANVSWRPSALTTLTLTASTAIDGTTVAASAGTLTHAANLRLQHELLRHFILSAQLGFAHVDYKGASLIEETLSAGLGAEYIFSREAALIATHRYQAFRANTGTGTGAGAGGRDYTSNEIRLGMRFRR